MHCLGKGCKFYRDTDIGILCDLVIDQLCESGECIGYDKIQKRKEEIIFEIAKLSSRLDQLEVLQEKLKQS